jgi:hypothetical protein
VAGQDKIEIVSRGLDRVGRDRVSRGLHRVGSDRVSRGLDRRRI